MAVKTIRSQAVQRRVVSVSYVSCPPAFVQVPELELRTSRTKRRESIAPTRGHTRKEETNHPSAPQIRLEFACIELH